MRDQPCLVSERRHRLRISFTVCPPLPSLEVIRQLAEHQRALAVSLGVREEHFAVNEDGFQVVPAGGRVAIRGQLVVDSLQ